MNLETFIAYVVLPILSAGVLLVGYRFLKGPSISDRIICADILFTIGTAFIALYSIMVRKSIFLDIALMFALIAFLSTIAFSYFLINRSKNKIKNQKRK